MEAYPCRLLTLTGGEPLSQPEAFPLVTRLLDRGFWVLVETSGHVPIDGLDPRAVAILDVKAPGSGEAGRMHAANLDAPAAARRGEAGARRPRGLRVGARPRARSARSRGRTRSSSRPCTAASIPGTLGRWIVEDGLPVRLQVQLHKYLWPGVERGV